MNAAELARYIDHTCLKILTSPQEIEQTCREAREWAVASICIPPSWVKEASALLRGSAVHVGTVIGFPLGYSVSPAKVLEAETAQDNGADEIDIVMHVGRFKAGGHQAVEKELKAIIRATPELTHKIIIECCVLSDSEKEAATRLVLNSGAEYIKTSTGFGSGGATEGDVRLLIKACDGRLKVKAAGGIKNLETALRLIRAGAERIGTSSTNKILSECKEM
jgi:deoxyribose-phosphate aldolase